jgi:alanyl-tRNA synthetase
MANEIILQNSPVRTRLMAVDDAIAEGAMALFGEKYGDEVRVVSMGTGVRGVKANRPYSVELCGGTHVAATGEIGLVRVLSDSAVSAGVRRIEALTGDAARQHLTEQDEKLRQAASLLKVQPGDVPSRIEALMDERRKLERELTEARKKLALAAAVPRAAMKAVTSAGSSISARWLPAWRRRNSRVWWMPPRRRSDPALRPSWRSARTARPASLSALPRT